MDRLYKFKGKKIMIIGHTGFKGSWLTAWLKKIGCQIIGISNNIPTKPSHFQNSKIYKDITDLRFDIRDDKKLRKEILRHKPDYLFHLAAQSIVLKSYEYPRETWETNVFGTMNVLESLRDLKKNVLLF